jgi:cytochrome c
MLAEGFRRGGRAARALVGAAALGATFLTLAAPGAPAGDALARARSCDACHAPARKRIGPSYDAIAERYRGQAGVAAALALKIRHGGAGAWGAVPMPANTQVSPAEAEALAAWILARPAPARP